MLPPLWTFSLTCTYVFLALPCGPSLVLCDGISLALCGDLSSLVVLPWLFVVVLPWFPLMVPPRPPMIPSWPSVVVLPWSFLSPGPSLWSWSFLVVAVLPGGCGPSLRSWCGPGPLWSWPCFVDLDLDLTSSSISLFLIPLLLPFAVVLHMYCILTTFLIKIFHF